MLEVSCMCINFATQITLIAYAAGHATVNTAKDVFSIHDPSEGIALYHVVDRGESQNPSSQKHKNTTAAASFLYSRFQDCHEWKRSWRHLCF